jgi:hypothetical protein
MVTVSFMEEIVSVLWVEDFGALSLFLDQKVSEMIGYLLKTPEMKAKLRSGVKCA